MGIDQIWHDFQNCVVSKTNWWLCEIETCFFNSYYRCGHVCRIRGVFDLCVKFLRRDLFCFWLQQKGDEGEEGVTSEGRVTWMSLNYQLHLSFLFNFLLLLFTHHFQNSTSSWRSGPKLQRWRPDFHRPLLASQVWHRERPTARSLKHRRRGCSPCRPATVTLKILTSPSRLSWP